MVKVVDNFLSQEDCKILIESNSTDLKPQPEAAYERRCVSKFIELPNIKERVSKLVNELRNNLQIDNKFELIKYVPQDHFQWHNDIQLGNPKVHKISTVILLNKDFKGGELLIRENLKESTVDIKTGSLVIFPSKLKHKVNRITQGTRYSLCCWFYTNSENKVNVI